MTTKQITKIIETELGLEESTKDYYKDMTPWDSHTLTGTYKKGGKTGGDFYVVKAEKNIFVICFNDYKLLSDIKDDVIEVLSEYGRVHVGLSTVDLFI